MWLDVDEETVLARIDSSRGLIPVLLQAGEECSLLSEEMGEIYTAMIEDVVFIIRYGAHCRHRFSVISDKDLLDILRIRRSKSHVVYKRYFQSYCSMSIYQNAIETIEDAIVAWQWLNGEEGDYSLCNIAEGLKIRPIVLKHLILQKISPEKYQWLLQLQASR